MLTLPPRLRPGDTIAIFSPSSPATVFAPTRFQRAKEFIQAKGFHILEGSLTGKADHYRSGSVQDWPKTTQTNQLITVFPGIAEGKLVGGNLNTMSGFFGSVYMPAMEKGDVLLLEDCFSNAQVIERSFAMLKLNGVLDRVGGIILGKHELYDDTGTGRKPHGILVEILNGRKIPFLAEFDTAHTHSMVPVPLGIRMRLDADMQTVSLLEPWVKV